MLASVFGADKERLLTPEPNIHTVGDTTAKRVHRFIATLSSKGMAIGFYSKRGRAKQLVVSVDPQCQTLVVPGEKPVPLLDIWEIRLGCRTNVLILAKPPAEHAQGCFSLVLKSRATLDFRASCAAERDCWVDAIASMWQTQDVKAAARPDAQLHRLWKQADKNGDNRLTKAEIQKLLFAINAQISPHELGKMFREVDADNSGNLNFEEFATLYHRLSDNPAVRKLFTEYSNGQLLITPQDAARFMRREGLEDHNPPAHDMTFEEFHKWVVDPRENTWFGKKHHTVHMDMTQPIHHYFIASSHNTYLSGDQLKSDSRVDMYVLALEKGCRCVELDCWDGPNGEPIVYHGFTCTSKILFRDIVVAINEYAFKKSPYPVVLSLEVHTSLPQQARMAEIMKQVFGDRLAKPVGPEKAAAMTPESLRHKFLVKGKMIPSSPTPSSPAEEESGGGDEETERVEAAAANGAQREAVHCAKGVAPELSQCVWMKTASRKTVLLHADKGAFYEVASFSENAVETMRQTAMKDFVRMNTVMFSRVYPKGTRIGSDNYNPQIGWECGSQLVALNYQTMDFPMRLNDAKFRDNGRCGYLLKPAHLRDPANHPPAPPVTLTVFVANGYRLPKVNQKKGGEVVDPYVCLRITGAACDCTLETAVPRTRTVEDNGFNPVWDEGFEFAVKFPELAILTLRIMDADVAGSDDIVAESSIALTCLREGWRVVPLTSPSTGTPVENGHLFCQFRMHTVDSSSS
eukprot:TRINITY_DN9674_c0_g1_i1.p1 TRINITY_DN9674_c0_g1~~TRINITY_DN9674_c0_g1_i1.p1  ORF type:complete len:745 (+),score=166.27 TRINITY_DN9674_c0_g1_i1:68-2302(+)